MLQLIVKILMFFAGFGIVFYFVERRDNKRYRKRMQVVLDREWGCETREEYSEEIMQNISYYARQTHSKQDIDVITWNDLEMDMVFRRLNHTRTSAGEEVLYRMLQTPCYCEEPLLEREDTIQSFLAHPDLRSDLEIALYAIGKNNKISIYEYLSRTKKIQKISRWPHILAAVLLLFFGVLLFITPAKAVVPFIAVMFLNVWFYYREKAKIGSAMVVFQFILETVTQCKAIARIRIPGCEDYFQRLGVLCRKFTIFSRFHFLVSAGKSMTGNLFDAVFDYVRILFHVDLIKIATMIREVRKYEKELLEIYEIIGYLDSMLAVASYRFAVKQYAIPELFAAGNAEDARKMFVTGLYHPLLEHPVANDFNTERCMLLTGSNASGKSTFIKAVAINAIFAQTIHTVLAKTYRTPYYRIYSSMALRDDILSSESYFIVEIKSLKRIFDKLAVSDIPVLCFIDEILRGTNTVERVAASAQLLEELSAQNVMCFAATHDIELTYLLNTGFSNYHFEEILSRSDISFDYQLKKGRANSRNAIRLLAITGFPERLVKKAQERVEIFLREGKWKEIE